MKATKKYLHKTFSRDAIRDFTCVVEMQSWNVNSSSYFLCSVNQLCKT
jgi:hypothetical protein